MKKIKWRWKFDCYLPFCPYCDTKVDETNNKCDHCGRKFKWTILKHKPTIFEIGHYTIMQCLDNSVRVYNKNDNVLVFLIEHTKKLSKRKLKKEIESLFKLLEIKLI